MKPKTKRNIAFADEVIAIGEIFTSKQVIERVFAKKEENPFQGRHRTLRLIPTTVGMTMALRACDRYLELGLKGGVSAWRREA